MLSIIAIVAYLLIGILTAFVVRVFATVNGRYVDEVRLGVMFMFWPLLIVILPHNYNYRLANQVGYKNRRSYGHLATPTPTRPTRIIV